MDDNAKKWIKENGFLIKDIVFKDDEITSKSQYNYFYGKSKSSFSGDGYCLFNKKNSHSGNLHVMKKEIEEEIFKLDNMPISIK